MRRQALALVACCAMAGTPIALADAGNPSNAPTPTTAPQSSPPCSSAEQLKAAESDRHWQQRDPLARRPGPCAGLEPLARKLRERHKRWRAYRLIVGDSPGAPAGGYPSGCSGGGRWLRYVSVPGFVVQHESGCSWAARNPSSGACGPYQLNGWTSCETSSWGDKMRHHRMAALVLREQGLGPAWTSNW